MLATEANKLSQGDCRKSTDGLPMVHNLSHGDRYDYSFEEHKDTEEGSFMQVTTFEHELRALMHVLKHNLKMIGSPVIGGVLQESSWDNYDYLADHMISCVDPIGNTFLTPCQDPKHKIHGNCVFENEYKHHMLKKKQDDNMDEEHDYLDLLAESRELATLTTTS
jgi:hypothetical protein